MTLAALRASKEMAVLTAFLAAITLLLPDGALRGIAGTILILIMPGLAVMHVIDPAGIFDRRALALVPGCSMVLVILVGTPLALLGAFKPWITTLAIVTTTLVLFGVAQRGSSEFETAPFPLEGARRLSLALIPWAAVIWIASMLAASHREFRVTEFWMHDDKSNPQAYTIGLRNLEATPQRYMIDVYVNGELAAHWPTGDVAVDATWNKTIVVPSAGGGPGEARADLFVEASDGRPARLYRSVWTSSHRPSTAQAEIAASSQRRTPTVATRVGIGQPWSGPLTDEAAQQPNSRSKGPTPLRTKPLEAARPNLTPPFVGTPPPPSANSDDAVSPAAIAVQKRMLDK